MNLKRIIFLFFVCIYSFIYVINLSYEEADNDDTILDTLKWAQERFSSRTYWLNYFRNYYYGGVDMKENVFFKNLSGLKLAGTLWKSNSDFIIIMAHGSAGNRFSKGLFSKISEELQVKNYNVLSFDFSGHGESEDDILTLKKSIDDLNSAITFAKSMGYKHIALMGHSLGALTCLEAYSSEIETMILIGALSGPVQWSWDNRLNKEQSECLEKKGYIDLEVNDGLRKALKVDGNILNDIKLVNQKELLSKVKCPVLIIHGDGDQDEIDLYEVSKNGMKWLSDESKLEVINDATHDFLSSSDEVLKLTKDWLSKYFQISY